MIKVTPCNLLKKIKSLSKIIRYDNIIKYCSYTFDDPNDQRYFNQKAYIEVKYLLDKIKIHNYNTSSDFYFIIFHDVNDLIKLNNYVKNNIN